jgi:hypothetical protein
LHGFPFVENAGVTLAGGLWGLSRHTPTVPARTRKADRLGNSLSKGQNPRARLAPRLPGSALRRAHKLPSLSALIQNIRLSFSAGY